ncbi:hypothetical protein OK015_20900 [Mycobacterium sp. Aquia_216]|uniref:hypothetical protein n=1 Tax=Mycobacterium sp. Aquia_216 TaxID=2991729 RepID=UPI00227C3778|nr:hypothetical protein [Mycobacterium sp. Aquia_216]WAJ43631.1 hypothetical protein OK015_20900 [Mycobacterium sp. Aquia_216]
MRSVKCALLAIVSVLVMAAAPVAHADDDDTAYFAAVRAVGVPANSPAMTTAYGRGLRDRISAVGFDPLVAMVHTDNAASGVTTHQGALIIGAVDHSQFTVGDLRHRFGYFDSPRVRSGTRPSGASVPASVFVSMT